ncbi:MAG: SAM-dependent DNA methyltransferase [Verrucomicrobia bacterium]|nr:SAM-dependent DNA methyltransferase [Verrucomicrobiota bacterium]
MSNPTVLVQKVWNYCNILRDDGWSYDYYVKQSTFLLFLKMRMSRRDLCSTHPRRAILQKAFTGELL